LLRSRLCAVYATGDSLPLSCPILVSLKIML
jgi:hypothetical protein